MNAVGVMPTIVTSAFPTRITVPSAASLRPNRLAQNRSLMTATGSAAAWSSAGPKVGPSIAPTPSTSKKWPDAR